MDLAIDAIEMLGVAPEQLGFTMDEETEQGSGEAPFWTSDQHSVVAAVL